VVKIFFGYSYKCSKVNDIGFRPSKGIYQGKMKEIPAAQANREDTEERRYLMTGRVPCNVVVAGACHICSGNLMLALERLEKQGVLTAEMQILAGSKASPEKCQGRLIIAVGRCVPQHIIAECSIRACPPSEGRIYQTLLRFLRSGFKTSPQAQYLRWSDEFNPRNIKYIPPVKLIAPP
jgi:hypothetical protein